VRWGRQAGYDVHVEGAKCMSGDSHGVRRGGGAGRRRGRSDVNGARDAHKGETMVA
jgi:hypothetical protein